ncbi:MAG TPA: FemAB family XrtA/PEP-CTERM system-associated protein [Gemmatimonadaceae bacterium]|nr:FemAB family XrtA/PEP-CTERM system-associated protein [Gemmatimonadaceae bacterium]
MTVDSAATIRVAPFAGEAIEWDRFMESAPGWTHFHRFGWRRVIEKVFGHECIYLAARDDQGTLVGVLPLVRVRSVLFGHFLVSMPFLNYGGPLGSAAAVQALAEAAVTLAHDSGVGVLELRSRYALPLSMPASHRKITLVLDMPADDRALWRALDAKVRSQIRRPQKDGITVRFGADQVAPFFSVFSQHMRDLGTPTQSRALFEAIAQEFGESCWFGCAYLRDIPVAAGCAFTWGGEVEMTWASSLVAYKKSAPNMLLYWNFMERAIHEGITTFNFGRCSPDSGTHRFKKQWGARDEPLWWYGLAGRGENAHTPSPNDSRYAWGPAIWRRLPTTLATAIGPRIVRYIP